MSRRLTLRHHLLQAAIILLASAGGLAAATTYSPVQIGGGGYVTGIVFSPVSRDVLFARTDVAGMFRWDQAGQRWVATMQFLGHDNWDLNWAESVAADPTNAQIVYVAGGASTDSGNANNPDKAAVLRSTDGGLTYVVQAAPFTMNGNGEGRANGERLAVDPNRPSILFMGTRTQGLWKSLDSAQTWTQVTTFPVTTTSNAVGVNNVIFRKDSGTAGNATPTIYASVSRSGASSIYRSIDGGATWGAISGQPTSWMPHHLALDASNVLYVTYGKGAGTEGAGPGGLTTGAVYKLSGSTWTDITPVVPGATAWDSFGYAGLGVSPTTGTVFVSTMDRWNFGNTMFRTTDGGSTWSDLKAGTHSAPEQAWTIRGHEAGWGGWIGDVRVDPFDPAHVIYGDGGGLWESFDATAATPSWTFKSTGIEETGVWGFGVGLVSPPSPSPCRLFSALGDVDGFRHITLNSSPSAGQHDPAKGSNTSIDVAWNDPDLLTRTYFSGKRGARSTDNGVTWTEFASCPPEAAANDPGAVRISVDGDRLAWAPMNSQLYYSTDQGASWTKSTGGPTVLNSWDQFTPTWDRVNNGTIYTYNRNNGKVYRSTNGGATYSNVATMPAWGVSPISAVPGHAGDLWIGHYDGLYRSTDAGTTWAKVAPSLLAACEHVGFGRSASGSGYPVVYAYAKSGGTWGFWMSEDVGATWTRFNDDAHSLGLIRCLVGDPTIYGRVYVASSGIMAIDVADGDPLVHGTLGLSATSAAIATTEDAGTVALAVERTGAFAGAVSVAWTTANGTALAGTDYVAGSGVLAWADGESGAKGLTVSVLANGVYDGGRTFRVTLGATGGGAALGSVSVAQVFLANTDPARPGSLALVTGSLTVAESVGSVGLSVRRSGGSDGAVAVPWSTVSGTAMAGTDFTTASGTLSWADGDLADKTIAVAISDDAVRGEPVEMFQVALGTPTGGAVLGGQATATVAITDNDPLLPGSISLTAATITVGEGGGTAVVWLRRSGGSDGPVSAHWRTEDATATAGADYVAGSGTVSWIDGDNADQPVVVAIADDALRGEPDETLVLRLDGVAGGAALGSLSTATIRITDNDPAQPGSIAFVPASTSVTAGEATGEVVLSIARSGLGDGPVSVAWATANGTASGGLRYQAAAGTLTWAAGETASRTIRVALIDDALGDQPAQWFSVVLSAPTGGAVLGSATTARITLVDDDPPRITFVAVSVLGTYTPVSASLTAAPATMGLTSGGVGTWTATQLGGGAGSGTVSAIVPGMPPAIRRITIAPGTTALPAPSARN